MKIDDTRRVVQLSLLQAAQGWRISDTSESGIKSLVQSLDPGLTVRIKLEPE